MKKSRQWISAGLAAVFLTAGFGAPYRKITVSRAASVKTEAFFENFDVNELDIRRWEVANGKTVELRSQYNALRMNLPTNAWGPNIVLQPYAIDGSAEISFCLSEMSGTGWLGVAFANKSLANFTKGAKHILRIENAGLTMHSATASGLDDSTVAQNRVEDNYIYATASQGKCYVRLSIEKLTSGAYAMSVYAGERKNEQRKIAEYGKTGGFEPNGLTMDGRLSFCGMGLSADVTEFKIERDGEEVFTTAFTSGDLAYPNESADGKIWGVSAIYGESDVYCGPINRLKLDQGVSLVSKTELPQNGNTLHTFDLEYNLYVGVENWKKGSFVGTYFGVGNKESFLGLGKNNEDEFVLCHYEQGKIRAIKSLMQGIVIEDGVNELRLEGYYDEKLYLTLNGEEFFFEGVQTQGAFAFGTYQRTDATATTVVELDDVRCTLYANQSSSAPSYTNNFKGTKTTVEQALDGNLEIVDTYINRSKYYVGTEVATDRVYNEKTSDKLTFSNCTNYGYFAPKQKYSEWILRFDLQLTDEYKITEKDGEYLLPTGKNGALIGVSFGKEYIGQSATETGGFFFYHWYNPYILTGKTEYTGAEDYQATHVAVPNPAANAIQPYTDPIEYEMWEDKNAIYNVMLVARNSTVKVYMKRSDEGEEKLLLPIAVIENVNTYGYVAITGLRSASFRIRNYSITNISPYLGKEAR